MIHMLVSFKVKEDSIEAAKAAITEFVTEVKKNEKGTILYSSYNAKGDETNFFHVMTFTGDAAEQIHKSSPYVKTFVQKLYPLCEIEPQFTRLNPVASIK